MTYYALLLLILCSLLFGHCVCLKMEKNQYQKNIRYTWVWLASFSMSAYCLNQMNTPVYNWKCYKNHKKQQKIVFKTSLLWSLTLKKAEMCASDNVSHSGQYRKVSFFVVGSKLQIFFSITCLMYWHCLSPVSTTWSIRPHVTFSVGSTQKLKLKMSRGLMAWRGQHCNTGWLWWLVKRPRYM